ELDERLDVGRNRAREAPHLGPEASAGDKLDSSPVVVGDAREAGFDAIDPAGVDRAGDLELLLRHQHDPDGLLPVPHRRVVQTDRMSRLRVERLLVDRSRPQLLAVERHARTTPSGNGDSFSGPLALIRKLSSTRNPPPPSQ